MFSKPVLLVSSFSPFLVLCLSVVTTFMSPFSASCMIFCFVTYMKLNAFLYLVKFSSSYSFLLLKCTLSGITVILHIHADPCICGFSIHSFSYLHFTVA
jgi:hypothetical protein